MLSQNLVINFNLFYNQLNNNIFRNLAAKDNEPRYNNAGTFNSVGAETEIAWQQKNIRTHLNFSYQRAVQVENYTAKDDRIFNVPNLSANLMIDVNPLGKISDKFWLSGTVRYIGQQLAPIAPYFKGGQPFEAPNNEVPAATVIGLGARVEKLYGFGLQLQVSNLLDNAYFQGGSTRFPYPQQGRWYLCTLSYQFLK